MSGTNLGRRIAGVLGGGAAGVVQRRRRIDLFVLGAGVLAVGVAAPIIAAVATPERITEMWVGAELAEDGSARITEVIDWDFGTRRRHGIFRDVPGLSPSAPVTVESATAPAATTVSETTVLGAGTATRIRIGDPDRTVTGQHRYLLRYPLDGVAPAGRLAWDAVGTEFPVGIRAATVHVTAPFELTGVRCVQGGAGSQLPCQVSQPEPGHLVATVDGLAANSGVTVYASAGRRLDGAPALRPPPVAGRAEAEGPALILLALLAIAVMVAAAAGGRWLVRRAGRERLPAGTPLPDPGWAGAATADGELRIDAAQLDTLATAQFTPPPELTPAQGGVLLAEAVRDQHRVAWLVDAAAAGYLEIDGDSARSVVLRRRPDPPAADLDVTILLDRAFAGRTELSLGSYDGNFADAWLRIGHRLQKWRADCGLWDPAGDARSRWARVLGALGMLAGAAGVAYGCVLAAAADPLWPPVLLLGAVLAGAGLAGLVTGWELRVRTAAGSAQWLRTESFRRGLDQSTVDQIDDVANRGLLHRYTAWAAAFGLDDRWSWVVHQSPAARNDPVARHHSLMAPTLASAAAAATVAPSSSSGSGGSSSGGSVGGGAGGGGGGSW